MVKHLIYAMAILMAVTFNWQEVQASPAEAQQAQTTGQNATGIVTDKNGTPIIGASVIVVGTQSGMATDVDGKFTLRNVKRGAKIMVSYVGYTTQQVVWNGTPLEISLEENASTLDEMVVVGFATQKKSDVSGAVSQVKMEDVLGDRPVINAANALQGAIPGLVVSGAPSPGQSKSFQIRGTLSINGGSPLVLIDNVEGDIDALNPDDIESVTVLKDAASSAIYGARAAGGVILITTKRPNDNAKFKFNYSFNQGWENAIGRPKQAPLLDYIAAYEEAGYSSQYWAGNGFVSTWKDLVGKYQAGALPGVYENGIYQNPEDGRVYYLKEGDVQGKVLGTGVLSNHNVSVSGGTSRVRFRLSGNYSYENGPMITDKDKYTRKAISSFISADITKWYTQELSMFYTDTRRTALANNIRDPYATRLISWYPDGFMPGEILGRDEDYIIDSPYNSYMISPTSNSQYSTPRIQFKAIFKPLKDWTITAEYTYHRNDYNYKSYTGFMTYADVQLAVKTSPVQAGKDTYTVNKSTRKYNAFNLYTNYKKDFGKHHLGLMLGFNQEKYNYGALNTSIEGQAVITVPSFAGGTGQKYITESYSEYTIRSGFGRFTYDYDNKYLLSVNGRYDGSSKFPKVNRFGFFPSVSAAWRIAQESFMEGTRTWLDELKLRASYGVIGNQNISPYGFVAQMGLGESTVWLDGGNKVTAIGMPGLVRANYTWEKVKSLDLGLNINLLRNRLTAEFDWYQRTTNGMLSAGVELPAVVGASAPQQNVADMRTRGWELSINWQDRIGDWHYRVGFNLYDSQSEITKYKNETGNLNYYYVGQKLGEIWGYVGDGYYSIDDFDLEQAKVNQWVLKEGVTSINGVKVQPGDVKFKNIDGDENNQITAGEGTYKNPGDRKIIGNNLPRYHFGANLAVGWKGIELSAILQGVGKRDYWLSGPSIFPFGGASDGVFQAVYYNQTDYWQAKSYDPTSPDYMVAKNPDAKLFRVYGQMANVGSNTRVSDKYLQSAAYMRVKNVTLSYSFPRPLLNKIHVDNLRLYVSVENLGTITSLPKGYDPEGNGSGTPSWGYPYYRTWSIGANISF